MVSVPSGGSWWEQQRARPGEPGRAEVSVPSGGSWWEQHEPPNLSAWTGPCFSTLWWVVVGATCGRDARDRGRHSFSTLWWVVVGATRLSQKRFGLTLRFQYPLVGRGGSNQAERDAWHSEEKLFQYPLVGRGGSNLLPDAIFPLGTEVSVPSGGSWWEQHRPGLCLYCRSEVSVPSGGSWWEQHTVWGQHRPRRFPFQYPLVGRGGSNAAEQPGGRCVGVAFQYPLVGRGGSNSSVAV